LNHGGSALDLPIEPLEGIGVPDLLPMRHGEVGERPATLKSQFPTVATMPIECKVEITVVSHR